MRLKNDVGAVLRGRGGQLRRVAGHYVTDVMQIGYRLIALNGDERGTETRIVAHHLYRQIAAGEWTVVDGWVWNQTKEK